ncbi:MAG: FkbM family methyltransferase, partial [Anaerolineae bacterium]|nr:FkbM family methyltransferase [Anaerolineae bacterium]
SNTYSFEQQGWTGICIEAHPDYIDILKKNRPNSHVVFAAASDKSGTVTFYTNKRGSLSTLDPSQEEKFKAHGEYFTGFVEREVPMMTLTEILDDANAPQIIDVLSIDVEGAEMQVLAGMDWGKYTARVVIIEASDEEEAEVSAYFDRFNYHKARNYFGNIFFCSNAADAQTIAEADVTCSVTHTPHPLDKIQQEQQFEIINSQLILPESYKLPMETKKSSAQWIKKFRYYGKRLAQWLRS